MIYRKLKRTHTFGYTNFIPGFREAFPELSKLDSSELADRLNSLNLDFYYEKKTAVHPLIRLTLPFAILLFIIMFLSIPLVFMLTGHWGYPLGKNNRILNWFKSLNMHELT